MLKKITVLIAFLFIISGCKGLDSVTANVVNYFSDPLQVDIASVEQFDNCWTKSLVSHGYKNPCAMITITITNKGEKELEISSASAPTIRSNNREYESLNLFDYGVRVDENICKNIPIRKKALPGSKTEKKACFLSVEWMDDEDPILYISINQELKEVRLKREN